MGLENYRDGENSQCFLGINIPLGWLCTKYHYFLPLEALIYSAAILFRSLAYFYSLLCLGDNFNLPNFMNTQI